MRRIGLDIKPRQRVFAAFFLYAFAMGGIFPRVPELQRAMGATEGALGLALIGASTGTLVSLSLAGRLLDRIGHRRALLALTPAMAACYALASFATAPWVLFALLVPCGLCIGAVEIIVNLEADRVEHQEGRRIMNRAHAFWSIGFFVAGLLGAGLSQAGISVQQHLLLDALLVLVATALLLGRFDAAPHRTGAAQGHETPRFARPTPAILALVAVTLSAMVLEGAGAEWSGIYMRDVFGAGHFVTGAAVAVGALMQAITRFFADAFVERYSPVGVARVLLSLLGIGAGTVLLAPSGTIAFAGFALMGVGTSVIFPLAMSAAAQRTDRSAAVNVATLAQTSFVVFLLGPPLLGLIAQYWGIRWSFGIGLPLVALSLAMAGVLKPSGATARPPAALKLGDSEPH
jgi:MFS family permease